ncbi:hypothetical protein [Amycolatopsis sp. TNS106]|uniref:hypothetical protein n=1 Tax=Amycolatopsis sp. TNS106 TaxID=2861750 RepID=UPI001C562A9E|nr:hypothetical protein [Amycolatopsis sp. TNS106]QXV56942.1 hypothetical protein CVV72_07920 [Amycolatopsis sp. TNS106]
MVRAESGEGQSRLDVVGDCVMLEPHVMLETAVDARTSGILDRFPLHLVGWRPRTTIVPGSLASAEGHLRAEFRTADADGTSAVACQWPARELPNDMRLMCQSPYDVVEGRDADGSTIFRRRASSLLAEALAGASEPERADVGGRFLDLGVRYVGRAFTSTTRAGAFSSLITHPTLVESLRDVPDDVEAWLVLVELDPEPTVMRDSDDAAAELVGLTASALVDYFQPPLNRASAGPRDATPNNVVDLRMTTERVGARLFSKVASPAFTHRVVYSAGTSRYSSVGDDIESFPAS